VNPAAGVSASQPSRSWSSRSATHDA
jgi:hypothetical protein